MHVFSRVAAVLVILAGTVVAAGAWSKAQLKARYPAPGRLVDVAGYTLHISCQGTGSPTVIMEAGQGESSLSWSLVQPAVARSTRVCAYDRAGLGWSDRSPRPRMPQVIVDELHTLLVNAGVSGPYILVGHSMGGMYSRLYAHTYPEEVVGMVLVDATHEQQQVRRPAALRHIEAEYAAQIRQQARTVKLLVDTGILAFRPSLVAADLRLPRAAQAAVQALNASNSKSIETTVAEFLANDAALAQVAAANLRTPDDFPLIVLARGRADPPPAPVTVPADLMEQDEQVHRELQGDLAKRSCRGEPVIAQQGGHSIHLDQPELVVEAIREVMLAVRGRMN